MTSAPVTSGGRRVRLRLLLGLGLLLVLWLLAQSAPADWLRDPQLLRETFSRSGLRAVLLFGAAFLAAIALFLPPTTLTATAGFLFGPVCGLLLSLCCINIGGALLFAFSRRTGREGVARLLSPRLSGWDRRLGEHGLLTVVLLRLSFVPFALVGISAGLSAIRMRDYLLGTLVGTFPAAFLLSWLGDRALLLWREGSLEPLLHPVGFVALGLFVLAAFFPLFHEWRSRGKNLPLP